MVRSGTLSLRGHWAICGLNTEVPATSGVEQAAGRTGLDLAGELRHVDSSQGEWREAAAPDDNTSGRCTICTVYGTRAGERRVLATEKNDSDSRYVLGERRLGGPIETLLERA